MGTSSVVIIRAANAAEPKDSQTWQPAVAPAPESSGLLSWFREFLSEELAPYPGRGNNRRAHGHLGDYHDDPDHDLPHTGRCLGALYAFLISRDNLRSTFRSGVAIAVSYAVGVLFVLVGANLFADQQSGRVLWFAGSMFVVFFALQTLRDSAVATGFAVLLVNTLPIWQMPQTAEYRVEQTLWQVLAVAIGTVRHDLGRNDLPCDSVLPMSYPRDSATDSTLSAT